MGNPHDVDDRWYVVYDPCSVDNASNFDLFLLHSLLRCLDILLHVLHEDLDLYLLFFFDHLAHGVCVLTLLGARLILIVVLSQDFGDVLVVVEWTGDNFGEEVSVALGLGTWYK